MGGVSGRLADIVILTSDNPRSEDPAAIIREIESALIDLAVPRIRAEALLNRQLLKGYDVIVSRREAIDTAIRYAKQGDLVAICGKGHEDYQQIGRDKMYFDDRVEAARQFNIVFW
jgi:UDP-N-acetylmuramyl tripeptide synthase